MSLFGTIQQSANALQVSQLGLNVVGNNIANANTPGYIRQELVQSPAIGLRIGDTILGYGVKADGVVQKIDEFVADQLRQTDSELQSSEALGEIYRQVESVFGELTDNDLSSQLSDFSASISDLLNQPGNDSLRRLVIERGKTLATNIRNTNERLTVINRNVDSEVRGAAESINRLTSRLAELNRRIVSTEGGRTSGSDAVGLRDERLQVLQELAQVVNIRADEQSSGAVTVYVGGEYLVADGIQREVKVDLRHVDGNSFPEIRLADTDSPLLVTSGRLHGLYTARDGAIGGIQEGLDSFASDLIQQFNRIHTQGQGIEGFSTYTSLNVADDTQAPLDLAGLQSTIENGNFEIQILDLETGLTKTHNLRVKLQGAADDTTYEDLTTQLDAIDGLNATLTADGALRLETDSHLLRFSFQNDTSGFLAAAGINTFFTGTDASTIEVNEVVAGDPRNLAASLTGIGSNTENALNLVKAFDTPLEELDGKSFKQAFEDLIVQTTQDINVQAGVSDGLRNFYKTLEGEHLAVTGVNLDEEAVKMIFYQRAFQASSRVIQASSEMLEVLVNL